ncbi:xanthine dehydrogenase-like isoform X2 [Phymastichus coffea]|uniref:xanthine dehydrogenase-like isoform X2 n=1 Tax=Phymastichus coffea TaxID=108790 RepID=UPI00273C5418|nr:xanthine dehydrogenase-like isoform X2 [Phymastichus coffea]
MVRDSNVEPEWTLLYYLRNKLQLYGTKLGCAEGGCGACTVMISRYDRKKDKIIHVAANACLTPVCAMHGMAVTTIEGIGSIRTKLHPVQERIAKAHGSQCGFCTPGIVMSMYALLRTKNLPSLEDIEIAFQGNLCRCTGYRAIIEGYKTFTEDWEQSRISNSEGTEKTCAMGDACCKKVFTSEPIDLFSAKDFLPYDSSQEPIFPPKLQLSSELDDEYLILKGKEVTWYRPINLREILALKQQYPNSKIIVGNSEVGVEVKFKHFVYPTLIQPVKIKELRDIVQFDNSIRIGASVTLIEMEEALRYEIKNNSESKTRIFESIVGMLNWFAGKQIRNVAAIGGNIMTGSPISDMNPILMAAGIKLNVCSLERGFRHIIMDHSFFVGYRRNIIASDEILLSIEIPYSTPDQYFVSYKQSKRRDDDIAIVNMALNVFFKPGTSVVKKAFMAFGGMAATTILAKKACEAMIGKRWNENLVENVTDLLIQELPLSGDAPGGMVLYRRSLTLSLFFKGFVNIAERLLKDSRDVDPVPAELKSAGEGFHFQPPRSSQYYQVVPKDQSSIDLIGRPIVHINAFKQATGEAVYTDDIPRIRGELYMALVLSTKTHANILNIDPSQALSLDGVEGFISAKDISESQNLIGHKVIDEEVFASKKVISQGQTIGAIVAKDQITAQKAAKLVKIDYEEVQPIIITIEDAIKAQSFFKKPTIICNGDIDKAFSKSDHVIEGEIRMGGQEHFYLETQACLVNFREEGELEIFSSTQNPTAIQKLAARVLNLPMNRITVRVKRLGGGFGGKETREALIALPAALAAYKFKRPVRCMLDRDEDMMITGTRHPFLTKYKVGFTKEGKITAAEASLFANCGYSTDLSPAVVECAIVYFMNGYQVPVAKVSGYMCKTNLPSSTAFRGFGGPQGMFCAENIVRHIADFLCKDHVEISEMNLYKDGDITFYNQPLEHYNLRKCWEECLFSANYKERKETIAQFNKEHRYKKRGIAVVPVMFGIGYEVDFLNQGGALVHVYTDGSVLLNHGGVEMGQGLYTKMIQVATRILKVAPEKIHTVETSTDKVPNTLATAASLGSDLNGAAVQDACIKLMERLKYIIDENPEGVWEDWIKRAYFDRVSLSATGYYKTPEIGYDFETNCGRRMNYYTYGTACTEIELDCLTGDHEVLKTDIVMDLGQSLNPAIDIGQIEGGFMQGYGLFTIEEMVYSPNGIVFSRGPGVYKIPSFTNIPREFNVSLLKGSSNPRAVFSSKAVGEPPLFLASSVFFAIKEAIRAARKDMGITGFFRLDSPATAARIRMACVDSLIKKVGDGDGKKAWNIIP